MTKALRVTGDNEVALSFTVKPGQKKEGLSMDAESNLVLRVNAPAQEGKANERVIELLAEILGCPKRDITLSRGHTSKHKEVRIKNKSLDDVQKFLSPAPHKVGRS